MANEQTAISLRDIGFCRGSRWILRALSWRVAVGSCAAVIGPNGSGKSTLARILAGHLWPTEGQCRILGQPFGETDLTDLRRSIRLLQPAGPFDVDGELTAIQVVLTGFFGTRGLYKTPTTPMLAEAQRVLAQVGLQRVADHPYATLSSGERIRSLIARALVVRPSLLLLDEPTAGLDLLAREQILGTIQALFDHEAHRPTVVLITHHVEELPPATSQALLLRDGRCAAAGAPHAVLTPTILSEVYGCPVEVRRSNGRFYLEVSPSAWHDLIRNGRRGGPVQIGGERH